jgi:hypothetical protein
MLGFNGVSKRLSSHMIRVGGKQEGEFIIDFPGELLSDKDAESRAHAYNEAGMLVFLYSVAVCFFNLILAIILTVNSSLFW